MKNKEQKMKFISGNEAAAHGVRLARVQVVAGYPITPATTVTEKITEFAAKGIFDGRIQLVESEHSSMATCIGAAMTGVRTFTATSSQGLLYMGEMVHWAAGSRLPIVMVNANRAICAPWALWSDQSDSMSLKDSGWMQFYCENAQEVLDSILMAYKLSEKLLIPSMVCYEGFLISHAYEPVIIPSQSEVDKFLPPYKAKYTLNPDKPHSFGNMIWPEDFTEIKHNFHGDMLVVTKEAKKISEEFQKVFGRKGEMVFEAHTKTSADTVVIAMGSMTSTIHGAMKNNSNVDVVKLKMFRPFPKRELRKLFLKYEKVIVIDRNLSPGQGGQMWTEIRSMLCGSKIGLKVFGYVAGLNGMDITPDTVKDMVKDSGERTTDFEPILWTKS